MIIIENNPLLTNLFFKHYCEFWQADLEEALLEGRTFAIIDLFKINLALLLSKNPDYQAVRDSISDLGEVIKELRTFRSSINILQCEENVIWVHKVSKFFDNTLIYYFLEFIVSYDFASRALKIDHEDRKIQDLLVEFNNALAHLIITCQTDENFEINKQRAIAHLHRGILDSYKEVIHANGEVIRGNTVQHKSLDNKTMLEYYFELRRYEAVGIGVRENKKAQVIRMYKKLSELLV